MAVVLSEPPARLSDSPLWRRFDHPSLVPDADADADADYEAASTAFFCVDSGSSRWSLMAATLVVCSGRGVFCGAHFDDEGIGGDGCSIAHDDFDLVETGLLGQRPERLVTFPTHGASGNVELQLGSG